MVPSLLNRRSLLTFAPALFAWGGLNKGIRASESSDARLLVVLLRGGLDGLAAVAPLADPEWAAIRGIEADRFYQGKMWVDGFFALNPVMVNLYRMFKNKHATIFHAISTPYRKRSHFDA